MTVPEKILNLEAEGNRKYHDLIQIVLKETQKEKKQATNASTSKGKNVPKATSTLNKEPKVSVPKASSSSAAKGASKSATKGPSTSKKFAPSTGKAGPSKSAAKGPKAARPQSANTGTKSTKAAPRFTPGLKTEENHEFWEIPKPERDFQQEERKPAMHNPLPKKRERSDDLMDIEVPQKRVKLENDPDFEWLTGAYTIIPPAALTQRWEVPGNLDLAIRLDPDNRLFVEFDFYICLGVMRSTTAIETRADGAFAKFEWCGRDGYDFSTEVYPPGFNMKGTLRFTRRKRDGRHVVKGVIEGMPAYEGSVEFMGERTGTAGGMFRRWDDYNEAAYHHANTSRWG